MRQDERVPFDRALRRARLQAYPPGEFVGQESFMRATEIRSLASHAGIGPGVAVLDLCCGVAGPGRLITSELGCSYLGVDSSASAIALARERATELPCEFRVGRVPPLPPGPFDVVMLLETMLAFEDKEVLLREVAASLPAGGRFAFTVEEGRPLTQTERDSMPDADTVWPVPLPRLFAWLRTVGLTIRWVEECSRSHRLIATSLVEAYTNERSAVDAELGTRVMDELLAAHRLWRDWLQSGRLRKFAIVAEKTGTAWPCRPGRARLGG